MSSTSFLMSKSINFLVYKIGMTGPTPHRDIASQYTVDTFVFISEMVSAELELFLNHYLEVQPAYRKLYVFEVCKLMSLEGICAINRSTNTVRKIYSGSKFFSAHNTQLLTIQHALGSRTCGSCISERSYSRATLSQQPPFDSLLP